jgi:hypothetical protein
LGTGACYPAPSNRSIGVAQPTTYDGRCTLSDSVPGALKGTGLKTRHYVTRFHKLTSVSCYTRARAPSITPKGGPFVWTTKFIKNTDTSMEISAATPP